MRRDMESRNSAVGRLMREMEPRNSTERMIMEAQLRHLNDPMYQLMLRASQDAAARAKEHWCWFYRRTTGIIDRDRISKAVHNLLERLFPEKFDPTSFVRRVCAALSKQDSCEGIVKVHSPPVRLIPKTLHPVDSVA